VKVLPHFLDREGRLALSPSLYERDAYQAHLRAHPQDRSGLRFDVQWRTRDAGLLKLRVDLRGSLSNRVTTATLELPVQRSGPFSRWSHLGLTGGAYAKFGEMTAWRATLWSGDALLAEQRSFLW
jgi:hypothetical protein